ncbi:MAG: DMT family transporter [Bacteroidota bacterium]
MTARTRAEAVLVGGTVIWGSTFVAQKFVLTGVDPLTMVGVRFTLAALFFGALYARRIFPLRRPQLWKGSLLALFLFLGFLTQTVGLLSTTASKSAFITGMMVIFTPVLQVVIERRAPNVGNALGALIVLGGLWMLTSPAGGSFNAGDALTLLCALSFGIYIVYLDVVSQEATPLQLAFIQSAATGVFAWSSLMLFGGFRFGGGPEVLFSLLYLAVLATILTTYLQARFQKDTTPSRAVVIFSVEPVIAAALAALLLDESLGSWGLGGGLLIVAGVLVSQFSDRVPWLGRSLFPAEGGG